MINAGRTGHEAIFRLDQGANNYNIVMIVAARNGHENTVRLLQDRMN